MSLVLFKKENETININILVSKMAEAYKFASDDDYEVFARNIIRPVAIHVIETIQRDTKTDDIFTFEGFEYPDELIAKNQQYLVLFFI